MTGLEEYGPGQAEASSQRPQQRQPRRRYSDEDDAEYRLAIEASKFQEEEDRKKRESRQPGDVEDDDLAKAIKLSKEEEERRRRELEETKASSLFDDDLIQVNSSQPQPQYTGFNQGYQQGSAVDFYANPIDQSQMQAQPTGYMGTAYTGFQMQPTGYQNGYQNGFGMQADPYGQQNLQQFQAQPTGYNPYLQQQQPVQSPIQQQDTLQPGSNNPWATNNQAQGLKPMQTGSNNPFARPQPVKAPSMPVFSSLPSIPEPKTLTTFQQQPAPQPVQQQPQREMTEHEARLNALLASGDGMDTFGNTGQLRIPAQHTAPGTFVNSAGAGLNRLTAEPTGSNPFLRQQFTGMPAVSYGAGSQMPAATGPAGMNPSNPFARPQGQTNQSQDLIQF